MKTYIFPIAILFILTTVISYATETTNPDALHDVTNIHPKKTHKQTQLIDTIHNYPSADAYYELAMTYQEQRDYLRQMAGLCKALEIDPDHKASKEALAKLHFILGFISIPDIELKWNEINLPSEELENVKEYYDQGILQMYKGSSDLAISYFKKIIEIDPTFAPVYLKLAIVSWSHTREPIQVLKYLNRYRLLNPNGPYRMKVLYYIEELQNYINNNTSLQTIEREK